MNNRDVSQDAYHHVVRRKMRDLYRHRRILQECFPVLERSIGLRTQEVVAQDFLESQDIAGLHRSNVIVVEVKKMVEIRFQSGLSLHGILLPYSNFPAGSESAASIQLPSAARKPAPRSL